MVFSLWKRAWNLTFPLPLLSVLKYFCPQRKCVFWALAQLWLLYTCSIFGHRNSDWGFNLSLAVLFHTEPAPPRSLYAVNATHSSVTLLWTEEGVVDYYQVLCKPSKASKEFKVQLPSVLTVKLFISNKYDHAFAFGEKRSTYCIIINWIWLVVSLQRV